MAPPILKGANDFAVPLCGVTGIPSNNSLVMAQIARHIVCLTPCLQRGHFRQSVITPVWKPKNIFLFF